MQNYLNENRIKNNLSEKDIQNWEITSQSFDKKTNATHVYIRQTINGIPISNGLANFAVKNGEVIVFGNRMVKNSETKAGSSVPALNPEQAIEKAAEQLKLGTPKDLKKSKTVHSQKFVYNKAGISKVPIPVELMYYATTDGKLILVWDMSIKQEKGNWWSLKVDATSGTILEKNSWTTSCTFENCSDQDHAYHTPVTNELSPIVFTPMPAPPPTTTAQYDVYPLPTESPSFGSRVLIADPSNITASPFGWHDTDGLTGPEYTITRGNNVYANEDMNNDDIPGYSPDGGASLLFDFPVDFTISPTSNLDPAITNLFYMNNTLHDIWYQYGFDEASGNFQENNYGNGGLATDYVFADALDGSGTDNANFDAPPDGTNPRMQMYLWNVISSSDMLVVNSPPSIAQSYNMVSASFAPAIPIPALTSDFVLVNDGTGIDPHDGCETILNSPDLVGKIAILNRGNCNFVSKVQAVQDAGAIAAIVINNTGTNIFAMSGNSTTITIPAVMISQSDGQLILAQITGGNTVNGTLQNGGGVQSGIDGDFDNLVIAHEFGHGISIRLTGGAANSNCLNNDEQMGEGWSDWFGLMLTTKTGDVGPTARGIGTYVENQPTTGAGIRPAPYSTNFAVNSYTYAATNDQANISMPHGIGFVWCTMLWDLNWAMINQYGFDSNMYTGTGGNNMAMHIVIEALKLQPCGPGFVDGRDAIIAADQLLYNGANKCLIWEVFAKRGLGASASQGDAASRLDQVEAFDLPQACQNGLNENQMDFISIFPNPTTGSLTVDFKGQKGVEKVELLDLQGKKIAEYLNIETSKLSIDMSHITTGIYMLAVTENGRKQMYKVVKE